MKFQDIVIASLLCEVIASHPVPHDRASKVPELSPEKELKILNTLKIFGNVQNFKKHPEEYGQKPKAHSKKRGHKGGADSSSSGGSKLSGAKGYGSDALPDYSTASTPPPPYSNGGLSPDYATQSYGQTGPSRAYWNGQYYPYSHYGYSTPFIPSSVTPFLFAGPFGFYGLYGGLDGSGNAQNATVRNMYINGTVTSSSNGTYTLVNGTFVYLNWDNGEYSVMAVPNVTYTGAVPINNRTYVNGTVQTESLNNSINAAVIINPNVTANGTSLPPDNKSTSTQQTNAGSHGVVVPSALLLGALLLL